MENQIKSEASDAAGCVVGSLGCYAVVLLGVAALALAIKVFFWILK